MSKPLKGWVVRDHKGKLHIATVRPTRFDVMQAVLDGALPTPEDAYVQFYDEWGAFHRHGYRIVRCTIEENTRA